MMATGQGFIDSCHERRQGLTGRRVQKPVPMMPLDLPDLPESWTWTSLSSLCERVSVGHVGPTSEFFCEPPSGIPFIRSQDVRPGKLTLANVAHVVESFHDKLKKSQLKSGDILIVRVGANRGDCCVVPDGVGSLNCANIVFARPLMPNPFLGFYFNSDFGQSLLGSLTTGSAQGVLNTQSIATIPVPVPPVSLQRKIASILSAYDDLIENNTRRIAILEEMAQAIYREWFVNFRFPGHENVKLVDSPLGQIPEGWEWSQVSEVFETLGGGTPSKKVDEYWDGGDIAWFAPSDLTKSGNMYSASSGTCITEAGLQKSSAKMFPAYSVMLTSRATIGVLSINTVPACTNQGFITCVPNERVSALQIFFWLREQTEKILNVATGATFKEITKGNFRKFPFLLPPPDLSEQFKNVVAPFGRNIEILIQKQDNLRTTRDLLLPKLISGKLDVDDLDIDTGLTAEALEEATA